MIDDMNLFKTSHKQKFKCEFCKRDKMRKRSFRRFQKMIYEKNECFDFDLENSINFQTFDEYRYYCFNTCRAIVKFFLYLLKYKNDFFRVIKNYFLFLLKIQISNHSMKR